MSASPAGIIRKSGISRTVFAVSLIIVAVAGGLGGYFANSLLNPGTPTTELSGAGSSLVYPLMSTWGSNYNNLHPDVRINYQSIGSGAGRTDFQQKVVDFAGTDAAPTATDLVNYVNVTLTIPEAIGAITLAYNVPNSGTACPCLPSGLDLNENVTAQIFLGNITVWNDPAIQALNPGLTLPSSAIVTVHRSDSSGTTFIFTSYLNRSAFWRPSPSTSWPTGLGGTAGAQNTGVATDVKTTPYSIGYVEVAYAIQNNMSVAYVQNKDRSEFVQPSLANVTAAVANANTSNLPTGIQSWSSVSLILEPGTNSYPIMGFTYILVHQALNVRPLMTLDKAKALVDFLWYIVHDGQSAAGPLDYPTLPQSIVTLDETSIKSITYNGQTLPT